MRTIPIMICGVLAMALVGCTPEDDGLRVDVDDLRQELAAAEERIDDLERSLAQRERRRVGMEQDIQRLIRERSSQPAAMPATAAAATVADEEAAAAMPASSTAVAFNDFLETDEGTRALASAMRKYQSEREAERRKRVVSALVKPFAEKAYLSQDQAERMSETLETAAQSIRDAWSSMRDVPAEERGSAVQKNIMRTQEIRKETDEAIATLLNQSQFEMYEEDRAKLLGLPPGGGGPPRSGGR